MICEHPKYRLALKAKGVNLYECNNCHLIYIKDKPVEKIEEIYKNYYKKNTGGRFNFGIEHIVKMFRFTRAYSVYLENKKATSVLDIGSGRGWMLYFLKHYFGYTRTAGTQISENAYLFSKDKLGLEIYKKDLLGMSFESPFQTVTMLHVLEHVENPEAYIRKIHEILEDKGLIIIEVPNYNAWSRYITKKHWLSLDIKHHLTFFTPETLTKLLEKYNFKVKKVHTYSLEYGAFTSTQSFVNLMTNSNDIFYNWLQNKTQSKYIAIHILLFFILLPFCFLINMLLYFSKKGEVLYVVAEKNKEK